MDVSFVLLVLVVMGAASDAKRLYCDHSKTAIEMGDWTRDLTHLDTANIENPPVSVLEGQTYVYENLFPNFTIKYIHVANLAAKTCGASASIKAGGVSTNGVMIVLHSGPYQEIRSVIDIWGSKLPGLVVPKDNRRQMQLISPQEYQKMSRLKSRYLFKGLRTVNHNYRVDSGGN